LAQLQARYRATENEYERRHIAREFQRAIRRPDLDEQAERKAEEAEFDAIVYAPPDEVSLEQLTADLERSHRTLLARDLRHGSARTGAATWREIADELGCSPSTARRLVRDP
jgi:hypothetical protein